MFSSGLTQTMPSALDLWYLADHRSVGLRHDVEIVFIVGETKDGAVDCALPGELVDFGEDGAKGR